MMQINSKFLYLPPYISTSWSNVAALQVKESGSLAVILVNGVAIDINYQSQEIIDAIFNAHAIYLEQEVWREKLSKPPMGVMQIPSILTMGSTAEGSFPMRMDFAAVDRLGTLIQHNPSQADAPNIPQEVLDKIKEIGKIVAPADPRVLPKAVMECNCVHCQIARAINPEELPEAKSEDVKISEEELKFEEWEITQIGDNLYDVSSKLEKSEKYNVYLGEPVGCTCGKSGCEHILAVLKS